jgi:hypothetical protein
MLTPWVSGRQRSARLAAILGRYQALAERQPELRLEEWAVTVQLLGGLASMHEARTLWAVLQGNAREGLAPPSVDPEQLAGKLRRLSNAEQLALLEIADRVALAPGTIRQRLAAAGIEGDR